MDSDSEALRFQWKCRKRRRSTNYYVDSANAEVEGLITCYLTSLKEMSAIQKSKVDFKEELN